LRLRPSRVAIASGAALLSVSATMAAPRYRFDIPAGPMARSVARISAQARVTIVAADPALLAGAGPNLRIDGTVEDALSRLLAGTRGQAVRVGMISWRIVARSAARKVSGPKPTVGAVVADVVVLGSKYNVRLSAYPASISLIYGEALTRFGRTPDTEAITRLAPDVQSTHLGPGRDKLFLRGVADSSFNGSGAALVGVYLNDVRLTYNAPDPDLRLYDVDRIEILEGPQGTLYGAGSMAGLIRVTPRAPDTVVRSGEVWLGGTSVAHGASGADGGGVVNLPLFGGGAALRLVGYAAHDGGYIDDVARDRHDVNGSDTLGGRAALRVALGKHWTIDAGGIFQDIHNRDSQYTERGLPPLTRSSKEAQPSSNLFRTGFVTVTGALGPIDVTATTDIVGQRLKQSFLPDDGNAGGLYRQRDTMRLLSEEVRLSSRGGTAPGWTAGVAILDSKAEQIRTIALDGSDRSLGRAHNDLTEIALFGEVTAHLSRRLSLTAGGRFTAVRLAGQASGAQEKNDEAAKIPADGEPHFTGVRHEYFAVPTLALGWSPGAPWFVFARFTQGYRPGGQTASGIIERFDADRIDSIEAGLRLRPSGEEHVSAQVSATYNNWRHIQADVLAANGLPNTQNIGNGRVSALTGSLIWKPRGGFEVRLAGTLADGSVTGYDVALDRIIRTSLPNVARDTLAASVDYGHSFDDRHRVTLGLSLNHVGRSVLGSDSMLSTLRQGSYWLLASGADFSFGTSMVSLNIDNLLDSAANSFAFGMPSYAYDNRQLTPPRPRTLRIGLRNRF